MQIAHKIELKPNNKQITYFKKACGISRFAWNWALAQWNKRFEENQKLPKEKQSKISGISLKKDFNAIKKEQFPWTKEVTKYAAQQPFLQLDQAYSRFFKKIAKKPKFKKKNKSIDSFYVGGDQIKVKEKKISVPNLGHVRLKEELRFKGKINSATFSRTADRWFVSVQIETDDFKKDKCKSKNVVGIDLGIDKMATLSNGIAFNSPKPIKQYFRKLKREQRKVSKKNRAAKNFQKAKMRVAKTHAKISNLRKDASHKVTTYLTKNFHQISIEDLNVKGMVKNHNLARSISDIGFGEIRRQLEYKSVIRKNIIYFADRFFPSSKTCSNCGNVNDELLLKVRHFECSCGHAMDRDLNAAINLEKLLNQNVRPARPELTPGEITAMQKSVFPILVTSIDEAGSEH